jgi:hypothetical protein
MAVQPLVFDAPDTLRWEDPAESGALTFDVLRGDLASLAGGTPPACLMTGVVQTSFVDASTPDAGLGWYYLVRGTNAGGTGVLGHGSDCGPRWPLLSCGTP